MALNFPDAPTNGQVFDKWTWDGQKWVLTQITVNTSNYAVSYGGLVTSAPATLDDSSNTS